jgi:hypothetical protein
MALLGHPIAHAPEADARHLKARFPKFCVLHFLAPTCKVFICYAQLDKNGWGIAAAGRLHPLCCCNVRKLVKPACLSHSDFCSGFGTVFQGVHRMFTLFGHYQEARAKRTHLALTPEVGLEMVGISRVF